MKTYKYPEEKAKEALLELESQGIDHPLNKRGFLIDVDGVVCRGEELIEGADEVIRTLREEGKGVVFVSNNSTMSPRLYKKKLRGLGIEADEDEIVLATVAAAHYVKKEAPQARVYVVGDAGLVETMEEYDLRTTNNPVEANFAVVGNPFNRDGRLRDGNDGRIAGAAKAILMNYAKFVAVNLDTIFPTENGPVPATGAVVKAIEHATGRSPDLVAGKPRGEITALARKKLGLNPEECILIGDSKVDMIAADEAGISSVFVRSGGTHEETFKKTDVYPDFVLDSIKELIEVNVPDVSAEFADSRD